MAFALVKRSWSWTFATRTARRQACKQPAVLSLTVAPHWFLLLKSIWRFSMNPFATVGHDARSFNRSWWEKMMIRWRSSLLWRFKCSCNNVLTGWWAWTSTKRCQHWGFMLLVRMEIRKNLSSILAAMFCWTPHKWRFRWWRRASRAINIGTNGRRRAGRANFEIYYWNIFHTIWHCLTLSIPVRLLHTQTYMYSICINMYKQYTTYTCCNLQRI